MLYLNPRNNIDEEGELMMSLFLDFLSKDVIKNPEKLIPYTKEMSQEIDDLLIDIYI